MLDTVIVSRFVKNDPTIKEHILRVGPANLTISTVTRAELRYGLAKRPNSTNLAQIVETFLARVKTLPWDTKTADTYGALRVNIEKNGLSLAPLDLMIAAHAKATNTTLATSDQAFSRIPNLMVELWQS